MSLVCIVATVCMATAASPEDVKRETPKYDNVENVVEAIVAKYPGKTVFVDFWATWCVPCINAMKAMEPLKPWMEENGIVKVYLSAHNSDAAQWESMIGDIGGEHYWLNEEEWKTVCNKFEIRGIPYYHIYNKKGERSFRQSGYPGNDTMKAEFEKAM